MGLFKLKGRKTKALLLAWMRPPVKSNLVKLDNRDGGLEAANFLLAENPGAIQTEHRYDMATTRSCTDQFWPPTILPRWAGSVQVDCHETHS